MPSKWIAIAGLICAITALGITPSFGWGNDGHKIVATVAAKILARDNPSVLRKVNRLLATDRSGLTKKDIASEATWADRFRDSTQTARDLSAQWHFVDTEFTENNLDKACFNHPPLSGLASKGPSPDCVVDKIDQFTRELGAPGTSRQERLAALRYLLHFVGDIHQPLHAITRVDPDTHVEDRGGNCVGVLGGTAANPQRLHSYWDTALVRAALGTKIANATSTVMRQLTAANRATWSGGTPTDWAKDSYHLAKSNTYAGVIEQTPVRSDFMFPEDTHCGPSKVYRIAPAYDERAKPVVVRQLAKAGLRLAKLLKENMR